MPLSLDLSPLQSEKSNSPVKNDIHTIIDNEYPFDENEMNPIHKKIIKKIHIIADEINGITNNTKFIKILSNYSINTIQREGKRERKFDIGNRNTSPEYVSFIFFNNTENKMMKVVLFNENILGDYMVIREIVWQKYATKLSSKCNFKTPNIYNYGKHILDQNLKEILKSKIDNRYLQKYNCIWYFTMDKIEYPNLDKTVNDHPIITENENICNSVSNKINKVNECLQTHELYHNDFNQNNVLLNYNDDNNEDSEIGLIDYGEADYETKFGEPWTCDLLKILRKKNTRKPPQSLPAKMDVNENNTINSSSLTRKIRKTVKSRVKKYLEEKNKQNKGGKTKKRRRYH